MIAVTQPRRVAAISLATRVATEQSVPLGTSVGYQVRFNERTSSETKIKYVTDGMLVRELLNDRLLNRYSVVVVDEAHERTLRTDLLIANLKSILRERNGDLSDSRGKGKAALNPLKVVIMSATLDAAKFSSFFDKFVLPRFVNFCLAEDLSVPEFSTLRAGNTRSRFTIPQLAPMITSTPPAERSTKYTQINLPEMS